MSEQKSNPNQPSSQPLVTEQEQELDKISEIALQESSAITSDAKKTQRELETYEGETSDSELISKLGQAEEARKNSRLKTEQLQEQIRRYKLETDALEHKNKEEVILDEARRNYTRNLFLLTVFWLIVVVLFVLATGLSYAHLNNPDCVENCAKFSLSENILIAFITSTTATVIGIFIIVAKWLFPPPKEKQESKEK